MVVPTDNQLALQALNAGYTGNEAVVETSVLISHYNGGPYYQYTGRAIAAIGEVGNAKQRAVVGANAKQLVAGAQQAYQSNPDNKFAGIMSKKLWIRIGIGAVGVLMLYGGMQLGIFKEGSIDVSQFQ